LSTHALGTSDATEPPGTALRLVRHLDLAILALALPLFVLADFPLFGYATGAAAWLAQRGIQVLVERRAAASNDLRTVSGLMAGSMVGRGWLVALAIFGAGLAEREAGLSAAILFIALFTASFTIRMTLRPFDTREACR
jgi:hypothetical protein